MGGRRQKGGKKKRLSHWSQLLCASKAGQEKREKGKSQSHQSQILMCFESRKERKRQEPVTSVTILMQPMAVDYMKLDNHAGSKGRPLLIYRKWPVESGKKAETWDPFLPPHWE